MVKHDIEKIKSSFDSSSKVVDENGEPLVVYHGTGTPDITEFKRTKATDKTGRMMALGEGKGKFYFTASRNGAQLAAAGAVARGQGKSATVMPVLLNLRNPISLSEYRARYQTLSGHGLNEGYSGEYTSTVRDKYIAQLDKAIRKEGFDGISDSENGYYIAFEPNQIKSVDNRGTFDAGENIFYQPLNEGIDLNQEIIGVIVTPTMDEKTASLLKNKVQKKAFSERLAGDYVNLDTGWTLELSKNGVGHAVNSAFRPDNAIAFGKWMQLLEGLPEILKYAKLVESHADKKEAPNVVQIHRLYAPARLAGDDVNTYTVMITVKEEDKRMRARVENIYEAHDARAIKKYSTVKSTHNDSIENHQELQQSSTFKAILRDVLEGVNDNFGSPYFQSAAPKSYAQLTDTEKAAWDEGSQGLNENELRKINAGNIKTIRGFVNAYSSMPALNEYAVAALAGYAKKGWYARSAVALLAVFGEETERFTALLAATSPQCSVETNLMNSLKVWAAWKEWTKAHPGWEQLDDIEKRRAVIEVMRANVQQADMKEDSESEDTDKKTSQIDKATGEKLGPVLEAWVNNTIRTLTDPNAAETIHSGPKVDSFMRNLRGDLSYVTNDTWMAKFIGRLQKIFGGTEYKPEKGDPGYSSGYLAMNAKARLAARMLTELTGEKWEPAEVQETIWSWGKAISDYAKNLAKQQQKEYNKKGKKGEFPLSPRSAS